MPVDWLSYGASKHVAQRAQSCPRNLLQLLQRVICQDIFLALHLVARGSARPATVCRAPRQIAGWCDPLRQLRTPDQLNESATPTADPRRRVCAPPSREALVADSHCRQHQPSPDAAAINLELRRARRFEPAADASDCSSAKNQPIGGSIAPALLFQSTDTEMPDGGQGNGSPPAKVFMGRRLARDRTAAFPTAAGRPAAGTNQGLEATGRPSRRRRYQGARGAGAQSARYGPDRRSHRSPRKAPCACLHSGSINPRPTNFGNPSGAGERVGP